MLERKTTFHSAASATATGTVMNLTGANFVAVQITGTFTASVAFQGTIDASNWVTLESIDAATGAKATAVTAAGIYYIPVPGLRLFRANLTWTSGTSITATGICVDEATLPTSDITLASLAVTNAGTFAVQATTDPVYSTVKSGEIAGAATETQLPDIACRLAMFKACLSNVGNVYLGVDGVTIPDGTTDVTSGFELAPGESTPWLPITNLNLLWKICTNATDDFVYLALT